MPTIRLELTMDEVAEEISGKDIIGQHSGCKSWVTICMTVRVRSIPSEELTEES